MKKCIIIIGILLLIIVVGIVIGIAVIKANEENGKEEDKKTSKISNIKSFYFCYSNGYAANSDTRYEINKEDDKYVVKIKPSGNSEGQVFKTEISKDKVKKLEDILNKYNVYKWDGFNKIDKDVLDGDSFSCSIYMENGKTISASGYMKWPENYREVESELDTYFNNISLIE